VEADAGDNDHGGQCQVGVHNGVEPKADAHQDERHARAPGQRQAHDERGDKHQAQPGDFPDAGQPEHLLAVQPKVVDVVVGGDAVEQPLAQGDQEVSDGQRNQVRSPAGCCQAEALAPPGPGLHDGLVRAHG